MARATVAYTHLGQTVLRLAMFLLATLIMCTALFDLDAVLGAFAAGLILRTLTPPAALHMITRRLEVVGFTFMIPLFFVVSGMGIDVSAVVAKPCLLYTSEPERRGTAEYPPPRQADPKA